jgi:hypothetical protein
VQKLSLQIINSAMKSLKAGNEAKCGFQFQDVVTIAVAEQKTNPSGATLNFSVHASRFLTNFNEASMSKGRCVSNVPHWLKQFR